MRDAIVKNCAMLQVNITITGASGPEARAVTAIGVAGQFAATPATGKRNHYEITHIPTGLRIPFDVTFTPAKALKTLAAVRDIVITPDALRTVRETLCERFPLITTNILKQIARGKAPNAVNYMLAATVANNYEV